VNEVSKQATAALRLTDALEIVQGAPVDAPSYRVTLACGFTPLHVQAFLAAYLQRNLPARKVSLATGLYGDLPGTLAAAADTGAQAVAVALEWSDLDARLGFRSSGSWGPAVVPDMVSTARGALDRIGLALERIPAAIPVALCLPTLPLPPLFHTSNWQSSQAELDLRQALAGFAARAARRCSLVNSTRLAESSPEAGRFDLNSDLALGLPYTVTHASAVGEALALLLSPPAPKKGLITDLDDTLWYGLVGEVGPDAVCWDLAGHHQVHGLYQKLLAALAEEGVLVGVASKNDPLDVQQVLKRDDLLLPAEKVYPWEVHWNAKSGSVGRILRTWNIGADSVVFVDDSPMELAQVSEGHPGIECLLFPRDDNGAAYRVLRHLRDLFGKPRLSEEDSIRLQSIRQSEALREAGATESVDAFLEQAEAVVSVDFALSGDDPRVLELVNKSVQPQWCSFRGGGLARPPLRTRCRIGGNHVSGQVWSVGQDCGDPRPPEGAGTGDRRLGDELPRLFPAHRAPVFESALRAVPGSRNGFRLRTYREKRAASGFLRALSGRQAVRQVQAIARTVRKSLPATVPPGRRIADEF